MKSLNAGAPHFKSIAKQHRHANYTLEKVIKEAVDNIIKKATEIRITTDTDDVDRLQELKISDNYINGFDSINEEGIQNPFNMGHIKLGHDDDNETSEFGVGLKAGALTASNQLSVMSCVSGSYYEVICDFIKMEKEEDVNASYNPKIREINEIDYNQVHPFSIGSSIIMSKIRDTICERMTESELTKRIKKCISDTYSRFLLSNIKILVNSEQVKPDIDLFKDPKCEPFTINKKIFVLEKYNNKLILTKKTIERDAWQIYDIKKNKWEVLKQPGEEYMINKIAEGYIHSYPKRTQNDDMSCIDIDTTFAFYSELFHSGSNEPEKPFDNVVIYKDDRKYGNKSIKIHNDGNNSFTAHKIDFSSKKLGKEIGMTFNKEITLDGSNELILAIKSAIADNRKEFNANTSTPLNNKLCEKAIKKSIINWQTCNIGKLSDVYRKKRDEIDNNIHNLSPNSNLDLYEVTNNTLINNTENHTSIPIVFSDVRIHINETEEPGPNVISAEIDNNIHNLSPNSKLDLCEVTNNTLINNTENHIYINETEEPGPNVISAEIDNNVHNFSPNSNLDQCEVTNNTLINNTDNHIYINETEDPVPNVISAKNKLISSKLLLNEVINLLKTSSKNGNITIDDSICILKFVKSILKI